MKKSVNARIIDADEKKTTMNRVRSDRVESGRQIYSFCVLFFLKFILRIESFGRNLSRNIVIIRNGMQQSSVID